MSTVEKHSAEEVQAEERPSKMRKLNSKSQPISDLPPSHETTSSPLPEDDISDDKNIEAISGKESGNPAEDGEQQPEMSKNERKRLAKKQAQAEGRAEWKAKKKAKEKEKKARKLHERLAAEKADPSLKEKRLATVRKPGRRPIQVPVTLVLDCDFDDLMHEKEINSLSAQLTRCYSDNKNATYKTQLTVSGFGGKLEERFKTSFASNHLSWRNVSFSTEDFVAVAEKAHGIMYSEKGGQIAGALATTKSDKDAKMDDSAETSAQTTDPTSEEPKEEYTISKKYIPNHDSDTIIQATPTQPAIVYLSSDSPNTLEVLSPHTTYIIGGIVDKNRHKGLCHKRARDRGIPTARLPIGEYMEMQGRTVLATNHVAEIMINWLELGNWADAFVKCIPKRKEAKVKGQFAKDEEKVEEEDEVEGMDAQE